MCETRACVLVLQELLLFLLLYVCYCSLTNEHVAIVTTNRYKSEYHKKTFCLLDCVVPSKFKFFFSPEKIYMVSSRLGLFLATNVEQP